MTCETCKFWLTGPKEATEPLGGEVGGCRRMPPIGSVVWEDFGRHNRNESRSSVRGKWNLTHKDDWCGEYSEIGP